MKLSGHYYYCISTFIDCLPTWDRGNQFFFPLEEQINGDEISLQGKQYVLRACNEVGTVR